MSKMIMIIDDDAGDRELIKVCLRRESDFEFLEASSGEDGMRQLNDSNPLYVILDTKLPGDDGFQTCRKIKDLKGDDVKVVMMTGAIDAVDAVKARKHGADDYCAKSPDCEELIDVLKELGI